MEKTITITLADKTVLGPLGLNGNNYISEDVIEDSVFEDNLSKVEIYDSATDQRTVLKDAILVQNIEQDGGSWFILREKTHQEQLEDDIEPQAQAIMELAEIIGDL